MRAVICCNGFENRMVEPLLPASKSMYNRLLMMQFMGGELLVRPSNADAADVRELYAALCELSGLRGKGGRVNAGEGGTSIRFLCALMCITPACYELHCHERFLKRPIKPLIDALHEAGADIRTSAGIFPIKIQGKVLSPSEIVVDTSLSSQFLSALMLVAPEFEKPVRIMPASTLFSRPYIELTAGMMQSAGINIQAIGSGFLIHPGKYNTRNITIEADWSAAAFWYSLCATHSEIQLVLKGLNLNSLQGDRRCVELYAMLGVNTRLTEGGVLLTSGEKQLSHIKASFNDCPDLALPYISAVAALGLGGEFSGLETLDVKESRRLQLLTENLLLNGLRVEQSGALLRVFPSAFVTEINVAVHSDHRMAMSFAVLATQGIKVYLDDAQCVEKSYPLFWDELSKTGFSLRFS